MTLDPWYSHDLQQVLLLFSEFVSMSPILLQELLLLSVGDNQRDLARLLFVEREVVQGDECVVHVLGRHAE